MFSLRWLEDGSLMKKPFLFGLILIEGDLMGNDDLNQEEWASPHEFEGVQLPEWPKDAFPDLAQRYLEELSRSTETPIELASMIFLAVVATSSQKKYEVELKKSYREPVNIWVLPALPPGSRKSSVYSEITSPLRKWEEQQKDLLGPLVTSQISKQKTLEAKIKHFRNLAARTKDESAFDEFHEQILYLEKELNSLPGIPQLWTSDVTPEYLGTLMALNDEAMAILSDEGGIFDILAGLYSNGRTNLDLFLKSYSGTPARVGRQSKPPIFLNKPLLTIGLTVQPYVIKNACKNKNFRDRGLLGRFLFVMPKSNIGYRTFEENPMDETVRVHYQASIASILHHPFNVEDNRPQQHVLKLEPEALLKFQEFSKAMEIMMGPDLDYLSHINDWASKLCGQVGRIAALLHIFRFALENPWERKISLQDMHGAVKIGYALIRHALKVFSLIDADLGYSVAEDILNWIKNFNIERFTQRECLRKHRRYDKKTLQMGLNILKERDYLHEISCKPLIGAPSAIFEVNPKYKNIPMGQKGQ